MTRLPTAGLRRERLANGVTLLVQRRTMAPAVALATHMRAGFLDEPDDLVGVSHVLEHMLFKGTPSLGPGELAQRTKALGGTLNAYTAYDRTVYYASAPASSARALIGLQADQVQHPLLDAGELSRELGVIIQEARRKLDSPGAVASETVHQLLYQTHRIRRWRIGVERDLERFTRNDVAGYYQSRYVPERAIVVLVGDVDEDVALDTLRAAWEPWHGAAATIPAGPPESASPELAARRLSGDVARSELVLAWRASGVLASDAPALDVAAAILTAGRGAELARRLRDPGLVTAVSASHYGVIDTGIFGIGIELDAAQLVPVIRETMEAMRALAAEPVDATVFGRAQALLRAALARRLERYESRAIALADAESLGDVTRLDRDESDLLAVTPAALRDSVARWLRPEVLSAVAYLPRESDVAFDRSILESAIAPPLAPRSVVAAARGKLTVHHRAVGEVDVLTAAAGDTGQVSLSVYRMRHDAETPENAGLAALALRSMVRGTTHRDAGELALAFESLGGSLVSSLGSDIVGLSTATLSASALRATSLLLEVLREPRFDPAVVAIEQSLLAGDSDGVTDDMVRFPIQLALGEAFGDRGYGSPPLGTRRSVTALTTDTVTRWHAAFVAGGRTTIVAAGDTDAERLADAIASMVSDAATGAETPGSRADMTGVMHAGQRVARKDREQAALAMLFPGPSRRDRSRFAAEVWSAIAGGLGGRLFETLRSARSLAYTVMANSWQRRSAGGLLTYIACDPERVDEARDAMLVELERFRREPPDAAEIARGTAVLAGAAEMSRQTAAAVAGEIADAWLQRDGLGDLDDPAARYRTVTAEDVHRVASENLDPARRAEGVVLPAGR